LDFPTVQGLCRSCDRYVTTCPQEVHPECHATWRLMRLVSSWAAVATNSEVAAMFEISDATVRRFVPSFTNVGCRHSSTVYGVSS
jgi:hypothetical protein